MCRVTFSVDEVMGAPRPRFSRRTGHTYMSDAYTDYKAKVARAYRDASGQLIEGPVAVSIDIMRHLPDSLPKRVIEAPDMVRPDVDNVAKAVLDALNGVAYADDAQVVCLSVLKCTRQRGIPDRMRVSVCPFEG